ncbi:MAG: hypothetical protein WCC84_17585 [Candidatus Cybelea sp.]
MKVHASMRCALSACASLVMVAGCGGSHAQTTPLIPNQSSAAATAPSGIGGQASLMASDAQAQDLLYVSHRKDGSVSVYSYPGGKLQGRLLDVDASGLCSDKNGDVFIPERNEILEYAHGGTRPIAVLRDSFGADTQFCAVDPTSGDLAVSGAANGESSVAIYTNAKGSPKIYKAEDRHSSYWSATYDNDGNLFVEATSVKPDAINLIEFSKGSRQLREIGWNGIQPPHLGSIQWDGKYLAAESHQSRSDATSIFRYSVSQGRATLVGKSELKGTESPQQFWIHDGKIAVPNGSGAGVMLYGYPAGGSPAKVIHDALEPRAATVSLVREHKIAVTTYHYDNLRTGWNDKETLLTAENVNGGSFGLLHSITLDDQVDTQPLIVPNEITTRGVSPGKHDVVYVATENDSIYAIDASSGTVLFQQSLGSPVPTPLGCNNNGPNVGIDGTPVIDKAANAMYVIAYTLQSSVPTYTIHELNLANLADIVSPVVVSASHTLTNGSTFQFNATYQRQRPGLLEANGNIYAGFGSFCDFSASMSRGWLLGWQAGSLTPLAANRLNDIQATSPDSFFLSSVWMSGYGVAADHQGNIYFVTGNSDPSGTTYNSVTNISESVAKVNANLTQLLSFFTPSDANGLDQADADFGSGGVLLLPKVGSEPPMAAAAGKEGTLFLLSRRNLGGYTPSGPNNDLDEESIGGCWCGQSYFDAASDSLPRIVGSGGNNVSVWKVPTSPPIKLAAAGSSPGLPGGQDPGFFTTVSSAGTSPGAIIWALARPQNVPGNVTLFAFKGEPPSSSSTLQTLFQAAAGTWESSGGNANIVPVVANGKVYVASYEQLNIFGLLGSDMKAATLATPPLKAPRTTVSAPHQVTGTLVSISGSVLTLRTRTGIIVRVNDSDAVRHERSSVLVIGKPYNATGTYDASGALHAIAILREKPSPATWPPDR